MYYVDGTEARCWSVDGVLGRSVLATSIKARWGKTAEVPGRRNRGGFDGGDMGSGGETRQAVSQMEAVLECGVEGGGWWMDGWMDGQVTGVESDYGV